MPAGVKKGSDAALFVLPDHRERLSFRNAAPLGAAALLGRFLPKLGPLVSAGGPFFFRVAERGLHGKYIAAYPAKGAQITDLRARCL
jgi:hypothetical protein